MATIRVSVDTREVRQLALDLSRAPGRIQRRAPRVMRSIARELHREMKRDASGHRYLRKFARHMDHEQTDALGLAYEVGFNRVGQGKLAHIIVFGSINNAPVYQFHGPLVRSTPRMVQQLADGAEDSVLGGPR